MNPGLFNRRSFRNFIRIACFAGAIALAWPMSSWTRGLVLLSALSPYIAIGSMLARRSWALVLPAAALPAVLVMLRPRWLCQWMCPVGLLNDQAARLHPGARKLGRWPRLGRWLALGTLSGAAVGYPLVLWLDPLTIFTGAVAIFHEPVTLAAIVSVAVLLTILLLSALWPGLWCMRLCPLGGTQDLLATPRRWLLALQRTPKPAEAPMPATVSPVTGALPRRELLAVAIGAAGAWRLCRVAGATVHPLQILPPGATSHDRFAGLCIRCGNCIRKCPSGIISPANGDSGLASLLTPSLSFTQGYCTVDCVECTLVCPSGALTPLRLEQKARHPIGLPQVTATDCLRVQGRDCNKCYKTCPFNAIRNGRRIGREYKPAPGILLDRCNGCGGCEMVCPATPNAIKIVAC